MADMSLSNETCLALNFTAATADDAYRALAQERGVRVGSYYIKACSSIRYPARSYRRIRLPARSRGTRRRGSIRA